MSILDKRLPRTVSKRFDMNGDGSTNFSDFTHLYDRNGDGQVNMADVRELYPDMFYTSVRRAGHMLPYVIKQPMGWLALALSFGSVYASWHFYGVILESGGVGLGAVMALISAMALFAVSYYTALNWDKEDAGAKIIALGVILVVSFADILALAGWMAYARDVDTTASTLSAQNVQTLVTTNNQLTTMRKEGLPRSSEAINRDLYVEGKKLVKVGRKRRSVRKACPKQPDAKGCTQWANLRTQLTRAEQYEQLGKLRTQLCDQGYCNGQKKAGVKSDVLVENVAGLTGLDKDYVSTNVDRWIAILLEILMLSVFYGVTRRAARDRDQSVAQRLALINANMGVDMNPSDHVAQLRATAQKMAEAVNRPKVPKASTKGPVRGSTQALVERWRAAALVEAKGFWMSEAEAYESFLSWASEQGITPPPANGPLGFNASVRALGQMTLQSRNGVAGYVGYARRTIPAAKAA